MNPAKTHQQDVFEANREIENLKQQYAIVSNTTLKAISEDKLSNQIFFDLQREGAKYFNYVERFVAESSLLGAHENEIWARNFAEDCAALLESFILHFKLIRLVAEKIQIPMPELSPNAYASMQGMVFQYLDKQQVDKLKESFLENKLPIGGFSKPRASVMKISNLWQSPVVWGIGFVLSILFLAIFFPNPTDFQYIVFRIILAIAISGLATSLTGMMEVQIGTWLKGAGAFAMFIVVYFYNPAALVVNEQGKEKKESLGASGASSTPIQKNSVPVAETVRKNVIQKESKNKRPLDLEEPKPKLPITVTAKTSKVMLFPGFFIALVSTSKFGDGPGHIKFMTEENGSVDVDEFPAYTTVTFKNRNYKLSLKFSPQGDPLLTLEDM